jgi:uncharacterized protein (DUF302 family)
MTPDSGIVSVASPYSVDVTLQHLEALLHSKAITIFATIDHSGEAAKSGVAMRATKLLIFGSPKAGTPVMLAAPSAALDLPLKVLVAEDEHGRVWVSYNSPEYLRERHGIPSELIESIAVVRTLVQKAVER